MFTGLADLTLSHSKPYVAPHLGPVPPESQLGDHPLNSCMSLPGASQNNSRHMAAGQTTLFHSGCPSLAASVRVSSPSLPFRSESQRWQSSRSSTHPCLSCSSLGRCPSFFARYTSTTTPGRFSCSFCSSSTLSTKTGLARRLCTASVSSSTIGSSRPWSQSYWAVGFTPVSISYLEGPPFLFLIPRHCLHPSSGRRLSPSALPCFFLSRCSIR